MTTQDQMSERYRIFYAIIEREHPVSIQGVYYRLLSVEATQRNVLGNGGLRAVKGIKLANMASRTTTDMRRGDMKRAENRIYQIPHEWIVEAGRQALVPGTWSSVGDLLGVVEETFRRSLWDDSDVYVEIWSEAATMIGVLGPVCDELDVYLRPTEGECSETLAWNAAKHINAVGKETFIYGVGDFDCKGLPIWKATTERLKELVDVKVHFKRLAATVEDRDHYIDLAHEHKPPKNDNKGAVTLINRWIEQYGPMALEVDAIPTPELRARVRNAIMGHIDDQGIDIDEIKEGAQEDDREVIQVLADLVEQYPTADELRELLG
jgi:hypothetical protein